MYCLTLYLYEEFKQLKEIEIPIVIKLLAIESLCFLNN